MASITRKVNTAKVDDSGHARRQRDLEDRLLQATETLMSEGNAFTEISVERLAVAAGSSRATFYVYFGDKSVLLQRFADRVLTDVAEAARPWWNVALQRDPVELRRAMERIIESYRSHKYVIRAIGEAMTYDPQVSRIYASLIERNARYAQEMIERGQEAGQIRPLASAHTARALTWLVERTCQQMLNSEPDPSDSQLVESVADIIWATLYLEAIPC